MDDRRCSLSIWLMAQDAIRKAVLYHHTQLAPSDVEMQSDLRSSICTKIRDHPGGTFSIRTRNTPEVPSRSVQTVVAYRKPAELGTRRDTREKRRRETRDERRRASHARGDHTHTLSFFSYDTDVSDEEPSEEMLTPSAGSRRRRVRRSLIRRISYYPPRAPDARQIRLDFVNLEQGDDFTPPLHGEEFEETGGSSGMESDFQDDHEDLPPPQRPSTLLPSTEAIQNVMNGFEADVRLEFSPTTAARDLVQSLSMTTPPPIIIPSSGAASTVWGLDVGAVGGAAPVEAPDRDAAAMWRATEAAWDAAPLVADLAPAPPPQPAPSFVLHHAPDNILEEDEDFDPIVQRMTPHISDQERLGEGAVLGALFRQRQRSQPRPLHPMAMADFLGAAWAAAAAAPPPPPRPRTPPPVLTPLSIAAQQILVELGGAMVNMGRYPEHIVAAYLHERRVGPPSIFSYEVLLLSEERTQFRELHATIENTLNVIGWRQDQDTQTTEEAAVLTPEAPATPQPEPQLSATQVAILEEMPLVEHSEDFPPTFTNRARMKRQRQARAASAAATAASLAAAAAHAAAQQAAVAAAQQQTQQQLPDETALSVAGPSSIPSSFDDHERRKARRVVSATIDEAVAAALTPGVVPDALPAPTQRVLGAVPQQMQTQRLAVAAAAAAAAHQSVSSVHASSCPCVYCPGGQHLHRLPISSSSASSTLPASFRIGLDPTTFTFENATRAALMPDASASFADMERTRQQNEVTMMMSILRQSQQRQLQQDLTQQIEAFRRSQLIPQARLFQPAPLTVDLQQAHQQLMQQHQRLQQQQQQQQRVPTPATAPPVYPLNYYYNTPTMQIPMTFQSSAVAPPPFVDLPDSNPVMARQHMFTTQAASTLAAAAAAAASATTDTTTSATDQAVATYIQTHYDNANARRELQALLNAGMPQSGEAAPIGAPQRDIDKFSTTITWTAQEDADVDPCTVCMSEFEEGENVRKLPCNHSFHVRCIDRWLTYNKKCPNCRVDVDQQAAAAAASEPAIAVPEPALNVAEEDVAEMVVARVRLETRNYPESFRPEMERIRAQLEAAYEGEFFQPPQTF